MDLKSLYPNRFQYKTKEELSLACDVWDREFKDVSEEVIRLALAACLGKFEWMPNLTQFKSLCHSIEKSNKFYGDVKNKIIEHKDSNQNPNVKRVIEEGAQICKRIKKLFPDKNWMQVSFMLSNLKSNVRKFYPGSNDLDIFLQLGKYSDDDILEAIA